MQAVDSSLTAYQYAKSLDNLRKAKYGIYGLASANGFGEYITGKDMFGNELSEEERSASLDMALSLLGGNAVGVGLRNVNPTVNLGQVSKSVSPSRTPSEIIAQRTKGMDLKQHPTPYKQISAKKMKELKQKIDNRTITKVEYEQYMWNKKFAKRRDKGVKEFWYEEQQRILNNESTTRNWSQEQLNDILAGKTPKFDGRPIAGHHTYSASKYPHLADKEEVIYPATFREHFYGWHGGNWRNSIPGEPIVPIKDF